MDAAYAAFVEGFVSREVPLLEVLEQTKNLQAETRADNGQPAPATPVAPPPPSAALLSELASFNELKR